MTTINDVLRFEQSPNNHTTVYPFSVTVHVSESHKLTIAEKAIIQDAIVNAAAKIRLMRGSGECNFAYCKNGKIDWESEGFLATMEK